MKCPRCTSLTLKDGDGWYCLSHGSFGSDRLAPWERLVDDWTPREWREYQDAARVGEQLEFADVGVE